MSQDLATSTTRSKRTRIDPTANPIPSTEHATQQPKAPKALAIAFVKSHAASLQPQVASILEQLGISHLNLLSKKYNKDTQIQKMEQNKEFLPRSARIDFTLNVSEKATSSAQFQQLVADTETKTQEFCFFLKKQIIAATKIESQILLDEIQDQFIESLRHIATTLSLIHI